MASTSIAAGGYLLLVDAPGRERDAVESALRGLSHAVEVADTGAQAMAALRHAKIACALVALMLPDMSGADLAGSIGRLEPGAGVIVLGTRDSAELAVRLLHQGAANYLVHPVSPAALDAAVRAALERRQALLADADRRQRLHAEVAALTLELRAERTAAARVSVSVLESLVQLMERRDAFLAGHSVRVGQIAASLAAELGHTDEEIEQVREAGRLHDVGMLCIGDGILAKKGPLTEEEFAQVRQHVVIGAELVGRLPGLGIVSAAIRGHHEKWDGTGYPDGLSGEAIPWAARLIGAAEIYDALTTSRPYREATTAAGAVEQMRGLVGRALSPEAFDALANTVERRRALVFIDGGRDEALLASIEGKDVLGGPPAM
ncbi:MAG TPA: HD domain-containing phosphohydrolase [Gemmatimonadales bacterium]|nr:HD domain-containing phosphohydrolase [Gemmatimonadales bacterium]